MRRTHVLPLLALLASSVLFFGYSGASPALAGNCTANQTALYGAGGVTHFQAQLGPCTGVAAVDFGHYLPLSDPAVVGYAWIILPLGGYAYPAESFNPGATIHTGSFGSSVALETYNINDFPCSAVLGDWATTKFTYRIESIDPKGGLSWGSWHPLVTQGYQITC